MLLKRVFSGIIIATLGVIFAWCSLLSWFLMVVTAILVCNYELQLLVNEKKYNDNLIQTSSFILLILIDTFLSVRSLKNFDTLTLKNILPFIITKNTFIIGTLFLITFFINIIKKPRISIGNFSFSIFRLIYLGFFPSYVIILRSINNGEKYLLMLLFSCAFCDIFAYFVGKKFGKHKLIQEISPNKTLEGSIGGTFASIFISVVFSYFININYMHAIILGLIVSIISQIGDLVESLIKRDLGKKDSGNLIPGHGGLLDRIDSYILLGFPYLFYIVYVVL
ncbi:MAG: phosphatidate cytidylyltransferase [Candidatus Sericytochromatia bacterium]|nr:MAG: phosphatidate cytidylyltransferase [Candidatus Sericytochromatia bacterium]